MIAVNALIGGLFLGADAYMVLFLTNIGGTFLLLGETRLLLAVVLVRFKAVRSLFCLSCSTRLLLCYLLVAIFLDALLLSTIVTFLSATATLLPATLLVMLILLLSMYSISCLYNR